MEVVRGQLEYRWSQEAWWRTCSPPQYCPKSLDVDWGSLIIVDPERLGDELVLLLGIGRWL